MYALIENNKVIEYPIENLLERFPRTSFALPITESQFPDGIVEVHCGEPPQCAFGFFACLDRTPFINDAGEWYVSWVITPLSSQEIEDRINALVDSVTNMVTDRVKETFALMELPGANTQALQDYINALQQVMSQPGFPVTIEWPVPPF